MEEIKCSSKKHNEAKAISYCPECKIYMCNKCESYHSELFQEHHQIKIDKDINLIFTGFCKEKNHLEKIEFFCKTHNKLCCASCISKIKVNGKGEHNNCDICIIKDIKEEKKNELKNNINLLEGLLKELENYNNEINKIFDKINNDKEELKSKINKIFTKFRNALNNREDFILNEVDKKFDEIFLNENIANINKNLPKRALISLERGKNIDKEWEDENKLNYIINDCINIENEINEINKINEKIKNINNYNNINISFFPLDEKNVDEFKTNIDSFGEILDDIYLSHFIDSSVCKDIKNYDFILKAIKNRCNNIKDIKLIYRATRDGDSIDNFFNKCNEVQNIILLVKSDNNAIFGGFTKIGFKKSDDTKFKDNAAFVFSLDNQKIYYVKKDLDAIRCCDCCCPQFCDNTIYLNENFLSSKDNFVNPIKDNYEGFSSDYELNKGTQNFKVVDLEIYQIIV